jgi:hypothetical protein
MSTLVTYSHYQFTVLSKEDSVYELECNDCKDTFIIDYKYDINLVYNEELDEFLVQCPTCKQIGLY